MSFFNIHNHDFYSNASLGFPDVICSPEEVIQKAYDLGLTGLAITNHECISSYVKCLNYYNKMDKDRPFALGLGNECYLITEEEYNNNRDSPSENKTPYYHFVLMALDTEGYHQICQLSTKAWQRCFVKGVWRRPTLYNDFIEIVKSNQGHIIASSACLGSRIDHLLLEEKFEEAQREVSRLIDIFGEGNFYLEVQPPKQSDCDQSMVNKRIWTLHEATGVPIIPSTDTHYLQKEDAIIHKVFLQSQDGDREIDDFYSTAYLMSVDELTKHMLYCYTPEQINQIIAWSNEIPARIKDYDIFHNPIIPQLPIEKIPPFKIKHICKDWYKKYPNFAYYSQTDNIHEQYFFYQIEQGLQQKIVSKNKNLEDYIARLDTEWNELRKISEALNNSMVSYYSTMSKLIDIMWDTGSFVGAGRGSSAGFLTCYLLDITQVDPVPLGDYFPYWRHVALERGAELADIDTDSEPCKKYDIIKAVKDYFGKDKVLNVATFTIISSKTAIERACKGLGIGNDTSNYLKSLIPVNRGKIANLKDCIQGNEKDGIKPLTTLVNEMKKYPNLIDCALGIEGVVANRSLHAAGLVVSNEPYTDYLGAMRAPNGTMCTAYDLWDSEAVSLTKFDLLTISALQKEHKAMDAMLKDGVIQWQGSVRATYNKYFHPDVLDYDTPEMWDSISKMYSCFEFDTPISVKALSATHPKSVMDLSATNSLLRLMPDNADETPIERYIRYKESKDAWLKDTTDFGLNAEEQNVLWEYLADAYGMADSQEKVMRLSMSNKTAGYTLKEANKLRKSIARKDAKLQEEARQQFYEHGKKLGTRQVFLDYIWNVVFAASMGYSFSQLHSYVYSIIALQELNIFYHYNPVYWNVGCLAVEATPDENGSGANSVDYGEVAKAVYKMKKFGVNIKAPDINLSDFEFTPEAKDNEILYGLAAVSGINSAIAQQIINNRPYASFKDFYQKNSQPDTLVTPSKFRQLIKGGCFDCFCPDRVKVMKYYVMYSTPRITAVTAANLPAIKASGVHIPKEIIAPYNFYKYVVSKQFLYGAHPKFKSKKIYWLDDKAQKYFNANYKDALQEGVDYWQEDDRFVVVDKSLEKVYADSKNSLIKWMNKPDFLKEYNTAVIKNKYMEFINGNESPEHWSFQALSFYLGDHELAKLDLDRYNISHFADLPEEPVFNDKTWGGRSWKQYEISAICGTLIARNDNNHILSLLTVDNEVVSVKLQQGVFAWYKQSISETVDGEKTILDPSWLDRGSLLIVAGYRRGQNDFVAKKYKSSIFNHQLQRIWRVNNDGSADIQNERYGAEEA